MNVVGIYTRYKAIRFSVGMGLLLVGSGLSMRAANQSSSSSEVKERHIYHIISAGAGAPRNEVCRLLPSKPIETFFRSYVFNAARPINGSTIMQAEEPVTNEGCKRATYWIKGSEVALRKRLGNFLPAVQLTALSCSDEADELMHLLQDIHDKRTKNNSKGNVTSGLLITAFCNGAKILRSLAQFYSTSSEGVTADLVDNVGIMLDSAYANFTEVTEEYAVNRLGLGYLCGYRSIVALVRPLLYWRYNPQKACHPIDQLDRIPEQIPMAFFHSESDKQVSITHAERMALRRAQKAQNNTYLFKAFYGKHARLLAEDPHYLSDAQILNKDYTYAVISKDESEERERIIQFRRAFAIVYDLHDRSYSDDLKNRAEKILAHYRVQYDDPANDQNFASRVYAIDGSLRHRIGRVITAGIASYGIYALVRHIFAARNR